MSRRGDGGRKPSGVPGWVVGAAVGATVLVAMHGFVTLGRVGDDGLRVALSDLVSLPLDLLAVAFPLVVARSPGMDARSRRAWRLVGLGFAANLVADLIWAWFELGIGEVPFPSIADAFYIAFYPLAAAGFLSFPRGTDRGSRWKDWLDVAIVFVAGGMLLWDLVLGPTAASSADPLPWVVSLASPLGDLILLLGVTRALMLSTVHPSRRALAVLGGGTVLFLVSDIAYSYLALNEAYQTGTILDLGWTIGTLLISLGAVVEMHDRVTAQRLRLRAGRWLEHAGALVPYVVVAAAFGLMIDAVLGMPADGGGLPGALGLPGLVLGSTAITVLVVIRQYASVRERIRAEGIAKALQSRYRALVQNGRDLMFIVDGSGTIVYASPSLGTVLGLDPDAWMARHLVDLLAPDSATAFDSTLRALCSGPFPGARGAPDVQDRTVAMPAIVFRTAAGGEIEHEAKVSDLRDQPAVAEIVVTAHDVSDERGLIRSLEARYRDVIDSVREVVFETDAGGRYTFLSPAWTEITGYRVAESIGRPVWDFAEPADLPPGHRPGGAPYPVRPDHTVRCRAADGSLRWIEVQARVRHDATGRPLGTSGTLRDITAQRAAAEALAAAKDEAERANRAKSEFLSRISHELRTPLNSIIGFGELLQIRPLEPADRSSVDRIVRAGLHLLGLIDEVLDIARIETDRLAIVLEPVSVEATVGAALDLVRQLAEPRRIYLIDKTGPDRAGPAAHVAVMADRQRLLQVMLNLLTNAVKYNRDDGIVCVRVEPAETGWTRITVADTGPGIPEDLLPRLFVPFDRLGAERSSVEGTGLGLSVAKGLVDRMHGRIAVESDALHGTVFLVELPTATVAPQAQASTAPGRADSPPARPPVLPGSTVLVVEDNEPNRELLQRVLQRMGDVRVRAAEDGASALRLAREERPDLILLDLGLPDMDGREVLRRLSVDPATSGIPVAVLSADATGERRAELLAAGATRYLTKPFELTALTRAVAEMVAGTAAPELGLVGGTAAPGPIDVEDAS